MSSRGAEQSTTEVGSRQELCRYQEAKDAVPEQHVWLHKDVATGGKRGFITLECTYPSV